MTKIFAAKNKLFMMKSFFVGKRSKVLLSIGLIAIGFGAISKKVIRFPGGGCMKDSQEMTFYKEF